MVVLIAVAAAGALSKLRKAKDSLSSRVTIENKAEDNSLKIRDENDNIECLIKSREQMIQAQLEGLRAPVTGFVVRVFWLALTLRLSCRELFFLSEPVFDIYFSFMKQDPVFHPKTVRLVFE